MISYSIFIVDDEDSLRKVLINALKANYEVIGFSTACEALDAIKIKPPDLVLLDIGLPDMNGIDILKIIKKEFPEVLVIMITGTKEIESVVESMKCGASDYITKPFEITRLRYTIQKTLETIKLRKEILLLQEKYLKENVPFFIGQSEATQNVMEFIRSVAVSQDTPILIIGETGTGKELIASTIHYQSPNFNHPFIPVNCAAIPKELFESELFGYEKGAFSGAASTGKKGLIELAENGTLFLDEVGDLSLEAQSKLLRFLESGEFYRVGGIKKLTIKTRIISATNRNLEQMMHENLFRKDLYYRLSVIKVRIPSLNERREDIIPIAMHYLYVFGKKFHKKCIRISSEAEQVLKTHYYSGNVRELKNIMERAVLICKNEEISVQDLGLIPENQNPLAGLDIPYLPPLTETGINLTEILNTVERYYIKQALKIAQYNETKASKILHLNHFTFRYRRKKIGVELHEANP